MRAKKRKHRRILFRTVGMAWLIVLFTVAIFITAVIPYQRRQLVAEMRQRALVVYTSTAQVTKDSRTLYLQLGMIAALAVSAGFFLSLLYARRLSIPILNLERFAHRIAIGDLSRRIDIRTGDEIEQLAHSFNYMVDALQQAKQEGKVAQQQLVQTARQAGMAEMMSNVLHNVGNVLNSVGVTTSTMRQRIAKSRISSLSNLAALIEERGDKLADYLATDPQGRKVPTYLLSLSDHLVKEQVGFLKDVQTLDRHVRHVRDIIHLQQDYSRTRGLTEPVQIETIIEDALQLNQQQNAKFDIQVEKDYAALPECWMDRHKLLQILINLFSNARHAVMAKEIRPGLIRVVVKRTETDDQVRIEVSDNGIGIAFDNLTRIFQHGFTTRPDGHGFGLQSSAIAAAEMGGSLRAESRGVCKGATFVVDLPFRPKESSNGSR